MTPALRRWLPRVHWRASVVLTAAWFALLSSGCGASGLERQARVANAVSLAANRALPALVASYEAEGDAAIAAAGPDPAAQARALAAVVDRWRPVWGDCGAEARPGCQGGAWAGFRLAHAAWAAAIDRARQPDAGGFVASLPALARDLAAAWCALRGVLPATARLPAVNALVCPATPNAPADGGLPDAPR